jgi:hypothetical protein
MAYYFTNDRGLIMFIGFQYSIYILLLTSYSLHYVITFFYWLDRKYFNDSEELHYEIIFVIVCGMFYAITNKSNYQNY